MACLSPSPSGRRLSELLEEKQEPFLLDIHLLEKGCPSSRLLDGYDTALCWPAGPATDAAAVLKRLTSKRNKAKNNRKKQQQQPGGILKLLLSKILHGKALAGCGRKPAALQFSDSFKMASAAAVAPAPEEKEKETECYSDSDDEDEKQHSPVSVLEPHPFESSPVHGKLSSPVHGKLSSPSRTAAMDVFRELLDAATYSPALLTQLLAKSDDLVAKDSADDEEDDDCYYGSYCSSPRTSRYNDAAYWESHKAELARVSELVAAEVPSARLDSAAAVRTEREEVGAGVAADVLEALLQELVVELGSSCC